MHPDPAAGDVHIGSPQAQHLGRAQTRTAASARAIARSRQVRKLPSSAADSSRDNPRGSRRGSRTRSCDRDLGLATCASSPERSPRDAHPGRPPARHRVARARVAHLPEREQRRDRRQPPVDRRRRIAGVAAVADRIHIPARTPRQHRLPARGEKPQQHIDIHVRPSRSPRRRATERTPAGRTRRPGRSAARSSDPPGSRGTRSSTRTVSGRAAQQPNLAVPSTAATGPSVTRRRYPSPITSCQEPQHDRRVARSRLDHLISRLREVRPV